MSTARSAEQDKARAAKRAMLRSVAKDTLKQLPAILGEVPYLKALDSVMYDSRNLPVLDQATCPRVGPATISVINRDTFDAALDLMAREAPKGRVAVLNFASHRNPGGGWLNGSTAQEECLCYRSSLALSLHSRYYPWKMNQGLYTRDVIIIRTAEHELLVPPIAPADLPVVSVLSIAALHHPKISDVDVVEAGVVRKKTMMVAKDRGITKAKLRMTLRMAAVNGHRNLVLGALGCGVFANPPEDAADCWKEVLQEPEFAGGWWNHIWFAVLDTGNQADGNFAIFKRVLEGLKV
jgi:uncharacterized protein (TIGR02452 family)